MVCSKSSGKEEKQKLAWGAESLKGSATKSVDALRGCNRGMESVVVSK